MNEKIKLDSFELEKVDLKDKKHLTVINKFEYDNLVRKYNYSNYGSFYNLIKSNEYTTSIFNSFFIIKKDDKAIGYIEIEKSKEIYLNYAIVEEERRKGYATQVLKELSSFLLNNYKLENVYTIIDKKNKNSIKASLNSDFKLIDSSNGFNTYGRKH